MDSKISLKWLKTTKKYTYELFSDKTFSELTKLIKFKVCTTATSSLIV